MKKRLSVLLTAVLSMTMIFTPLPVMATENGTTAEEVQQNSQGMINDISAEGSDSTGDLISQAIMSKQAEQDQNNGCNIYAVEVEGKKASISFETIKDCTLLVAIYDEAGTRMLASGKKDVKKGDTETTVTIDTNNMPKYFYLRAYLIENKELQPLCTAYESPNYTQEMSQFLQKTTDDFAGDQVVNFDNDKKNNFAVYDKDTKLIEQKDNQNIVKKADDKKKEYVFEKISKAISLLKKGDIFSYQYENGETLIVKVGSIKISGSTATITGTDTSLNEVFDYVKIDTTSTIDEAEVDNSHLGDGITYKGKVDFNSDTDQLMKSQAIDKESKYSKALAYTLTGKEFGNEHANAKVSGDVTLLLDATTKVYSQDEYQYVELRFDASLKLNVSVTGSVNTNFSIGDVSYNPLPCVNISLTPKIYLEFTGKLEFSATVKSTSGASYSSDKGYQKIETRPVVDPKIRVEGKIYIGIGLVPAVNVIDKNILSIYLEARAGTEISAGMSATLPTDSKIHECTACLDGQVNFRGDVTFGVRILSKSDFRVVPLNISYKVTDFYYSISHNEFGLGTCPHIQYKVTATVKDVNNKPVEGAAIDGSKISDAKGMAVLWFGNGSHDISVAKKGYQDAKKTINVYDSPVNVDITLYEDPKLGHDVTISVVDENGDPIEGAMVNGVSSDSKGIAVIALLNGTQTITVKKDGYADVTQNVTVNDDTKNVVITMGKVSDVSGLEDNIVKQVSARGLSSAAIMMNGDLYTWGYNEHGQLGNGSYEDSIIPMKIMSNVKSVSMGYYNGAAITVNGDLYTWGFNDWGVVGDGTTIDRNLPVKIMENVVQVSISQDCIGVITTKGELYTWGRTLFGALGNGESDQGAVLSPHKIMDGIKHVAFGDFAFGSAVTNEGDLYMWGNNVNGQLGDGSTKDKATPIKVMSGIKTSSLGYMHSAAITEGGELYTWGSNDRGQLGIGTYKNSYTPVKVIDNVISASLGGTHSTVVAADGNLYSWGYLGGRSEIREKPELILNSIAEVSAGQYHLMARGTDGSLYIWGCNLHGALGNGTIEENQTPKKVTFSKATHIKLTKNFKSSKEPRKSVSNVILEKATINATTTVQTKSYKKLRKNTLYNFYVMKDRDSEDPLTSDNLLYIGQKASNKNGRLSISYGARENYSGAEVFVIGTSEYDLQYAKPTTSFKSYTYTGKTIKPAPRLVINGKTLKKNKDYTVTYFNNKQIGQASITLKGKGKYTGQRTIYFNIVPKKVTVSSAKSLAKRSLQIKWKKVSSVTGYQVQWSGSKKFTSSKSVKIVGVSKTTRKITKLSSKKKYYVRVRAYKTVKGKSYYGKWSASKYTTTK